MDGGGGDDNGVIPQGGGYSGSVISSDFVVGIVVALVDTVRGGGRGFGGTGA